MKRIMVASAIAFALVAIGCPRVGLLPKVSISASGCPWEVEVHAQDEYALFLLRDESRKVRSTATLTVQEFDDEHATRHAALSIAHEEPIAPVWDDPRGAIGWPTFTRRYHARARQIDSTYFGATESPINAVTWVRVFGHHVVRVDARSIDEWDSGFERLLGLVATVRIEGEPALSGEPFATLVKELQEGKP